MKALLVDDELFCRDNLKMMVQEYCPAIHEIKSAESAQNAREILSNWSPDILFLDIKMPNESGFDLLTSMGEHNLSVIFTTAHDEYALSALKVEAIDYLEKPINIEDLQSAVHKAEKRAEFRTNSLSQIKDMLKDNRNSLDNEKIAIPMREGYEILAYHEIVHLEASESYTTIYLENGKRLLSSKNIKVYEEKLNPRVFFRTHKSHIINIQNHIKGFNRVDGNSAVMSNGKQIPISRRKLQSFLDRISGM